MMPSFIHIMPSPQSNPSYPLERYKGYKIKASKGNVESSRLKKTVCHPLTNGLKSWTAAPIRAGSLVEELPWSILEMNDGSTNGFQPKS
jgi:hypothetical protein